MVFPFLTLTDQTSTIPSSKRCCQSGTRSTEQERLIEDLGTDPLKVRIVYMDAVAKSWGKYKRPRTSPSSVWVWTRNGLAPCGSVDPDSRDLM